MIDWSRDILRGYEPAGPSTRPRRAWHWQHGFEAKEIQSQKKVWVCRRCYEAKTRPVGQHWIYLDNAGLSGILGHLKRQHDLVEAGKAEKSSGPLAEAFRRQATRSTADSEIYHRITTAFNKTEFRKQLTRSFYRNDMPFVLLRDEAFRKTLGIANDISPTGGFIPSDSTMSRWIRNKFEESKSKVLDELSRSHGQIHVSFDMWTSKSQRCLCGIVVHFVDSEGRMRSFLLSLPEVLKSYSGANIAGCVLAIVKEYQIQERIGYFVTDNATNNDSAIQSIAASLGFSAKYRRLRCVGHILNLVAQSILFGTDPASLQKDMEQATQDIEEVVVWRRQGPIGKLHNVVKYIYKSPQRIQRFREIQESGEVQTTVPAYVEGRSSATWWHLERDNETRWNSTYKMINRALHLKDAVDRFIDREASEHYQSTRIASRSQNSLPGTQQPSILDDTLTTEDWEILKHYQAILKPIWESTMKLEGDALQGRDGAMWEVLPVFEFMLEKFYSISARLDRSNEAEHLLYTSLELGIQKLDDYYKLLDDTPAYMAAVVLHPQFKWEWIENVWTGKANGKKWIKDARIAVDRLWRGEYKNHPIAEMLGGEPPAKRLQMDSDIDSFIAHRRPTTGSNSRSAGTHDEYEWYINQPPVGGYLDDFNPITWWESKRTQLPRLSRMAIDILSVPAMSAKAERIFSHCGNIARPNRACLRADTLAAVVCLRQWDPEGLISWDDTSAEALGVESSIELDWEP